jgi:uncharacterized protein YegJ (DUF2314 family)
MMARILGGIALAMMLALAGAAVATAQQEPRVVMVPEKDPEMAAAIAKGRDTLPRFWQALDKPQPNEDGFALKVGLPTDSGGSEHIWANGIERKDGKIFGTINNVPKNLKKIRFGQRIEIPEPLISDWVFHRSGRIVGGYTIRALLKRMPRDEAARLRAMLEDP